MGNAGQIRILLLGPAGGALQRAAAIAHELGAQVRLTTALELALAHLCEAGADLVMVDVNMDVARLTGALRRQRIAVPVLGCGINASAERAVAAIRAGAYDFIPLPPDRDLIAAALLSVGARATDMVGDDPAFAKACAFAASFAASAAPMLILGGAGTGKSMLARHIHRLSGRAGPLVIAECAGLAPDVLHSELFGHQAGAFEGAERDRAGRIGEAAGGTLVLHGLDTLPGCAQARLGEYLQPGGATRIIATARRDPDALVRENGFRADLAARFALIKVELPPLCARPGDLPLLARALGERIAAEHGLRPRTLASETLALLEQHDWRGNVRELGDVMHRALLLARADAILPDDIVLNDGSRIAAAAPAAPVSVTGLVGQSMADVERELILQTLERCGGNRTSASHILGISVRTMRNKLKTFMDAGIPVAPAL